MANHDRVADLYYGRIDRVETQNACRDRVHWLCEKAQGERVLDIGCSQGITSIILGREGHYVVGIDIEANGIASAREALAIEPQIVQERVSFKQMDAYRADFSPASFDSVILGEVLEHLVQPEQLLARVVEWLADDGRLVVSVPHGYHPYHDHKRSFYLTQFVDLISERFSVVDVTVLHDRYLCGVATKPLIGEKPVMPSPEMMHEWSSVCDVALERSQRLAYANRLRLQASVQELRDQAGSLREELEELRSAGELLLVEKRKREKAERQAQYLKNHVARTQEELEVRMNEVRYRLGDALVCAMTPSRDTLLLPLRLVKLFGEGMKKRRDRRLSKRKSRRKNAAAPVASTDTPAPKTRPLPGWLSNLESAAHLEEPFSDVPKDQIVRKELRVAGIMDEFSWRAWQYEADFFTFTPETWKSVLESRKPHLLFVESTWHGLQDGWHFQVRDLGQRPDKIHHYALPEIVEWCRDRDIPTVFYNKEDPPNFEFFIEAAKLFDFIFTSDANCIPDYRERVGHDRVFALPFAAQPRVHNPVATSERRGSVCFAGTWYNHRHQQRQADAEAILKPALDFDLFIFDRMAESPSKNYRWPKIYQSSVYGSLPYARMVSAYKRFKLFLNINSVSGSPTMFARRVFELLASGTPVLSSESLGIEAILGRELVAMSGNEQTTRELMAKILEDDEYRERLSLLGQRKVFSEHTYCQRLETILKTVGVHARAFSKPTIRVVTAINRKADVEAILDNFRRQSFEYAGLTICTRQPSLVPKIQEAVRYDANITVVCRERAWGGLFQQAMAECESDRVAVMRPGDYYGPHYLTDYANAALYVGQDAIGKNKHYVSENGERPEVLKGGLDYRYVPEVCPWTLCLKTEHAREVAEKMRDCTSIFEWWDGAMRSMEKTYSADPFNYVRRAPNEIDNDVRTSSESSLGMTREQRLGAALV
ncbi:MAG: methyltransferase domain-containing protein [Phycisphaerales bacterium]|nr:methyltransferase domain-containing protein [Phycisphaerales bacterium]